MDGVRRTPVADVYSEKYTSLNADKPPPKSHRLTACLATVAATCVVAATFFLRQNNTPAGALALLGGVGFSVCCALSCRTRSCTEPNSVV